MSSPTVASSVPAPALPPAPARFARADLISLAASVDAIQYYYDPETKTFVCVPSQSTSTEPSDPTQLIQLSAPVSPTHTLFPPLFTTPKITSTKAATNFVKQHVTGNLPKIVPQNICGENIPGFDPEHPFGEPNHEQLYPTIAARRREKRLQQQQQQQQQQHIKKSHSTGNLFDMLDEMVDRLLGIPKPKPRPRPAQQRSVTPTGTISPQHRSHSLTINNNKTTTTTSTTLKTTITTLSKSAPTTSHMPADDSSSEYETDSEEEEEEEEEDEMKVNGPTKPNGMHGTSASSKPNGMMNPNGMHETSKPNGIHASVSRRPPPLTIER